MRKSLACGAIASTLLLCGVVRADPPTSQPVTPEQIYQILKDNAELRKDNAQLKKNQEDMDKKLDALTQKQAQDQAANEANQQDVDEAIRKVVAEADKNRGGLESVVIAGDANFGFTTMRGSPSTSFADFSPLILWELPDKRLLFESAFDVSTPDPASGATTVTLNLADLSYIVNDNLIVGGGLFAVPFGVYHNHYDPPWVNKFTDDPLVLSPGGLAPVSEVGFFARGAVPVGSTKVTYDVYVVNGPQLSSSSGNAGSLNFTDSTDNNNDKAVGGRIAWLPITGMETGYSIMEAKVNTSGFEATRAILQAVDFSYRPIVKEIDGTVDFRTEWIWSNVQKNTYDPTDALGFGPVSPSGYRDGGYIMLAYRPTESTNKVIRSFEFVARWDTLIIPTDAPGGDHTQRWNLGVDYWVTPSVVCKFGYEVYQSRVSPDADAFTFQVGIGL